MTIEKAQRDFNQMIMRNGFTEAGYTRVATHTINAVMLLTPPLMTRHT